MWTSPIAITLYYLIATTALGCAIGDALRKAGKQYRRPFEQ